MLHSIDRVQINLMELVWSKMEQVIKRRIPTKPATEQAQHGTQENPVGDSTKTEEEFFRDFAWTWTVPDQDDKQLPKNHGHATAPHAPFFLDEHSKENPWRHTEVGRRS